MMSDKFIDNLIQMKIAKFPPLDIVPTHSFEVLIVNGQSLQVGGLIDQLTVKAQGQLSRIPAYLFISNLVVVDRLSKSGQEELLSRPDLSKGDGEQPEKAMSTSCLNEDEKLLLLCTSPLLWNQNSAVLLTTVCVHWIITPRHVVKGIVKPLSFLLSSSHASNYVILCNIQAFSKVFPKTFAPYFEHFFIYSSNSYHVRALKLNILSATATAWSAPISFAGS